LLIAAVGTETKRSVEICAGDGIECNAANLLVNHGWTGLLIDGSEELIRHGKEFYGSGTETWIHPQTLKQAQSLQKMSISSSKKQASLATSTC
jgi:hypothetical protein